MKIIQIEVTSRCNASCVMCPKPFFTDGWDIGDLPFEDYLNLREYFSEFDIIWLQGWGEPLLSRDIFQMIVTAYRRDGVVGLTTNAMLLTDSASKKLIETGVKTVAISIAGARKETHESIRIGTSFNKILENVKRLESLRRSMNARDLRIIFTFLRMKQNIKELPELVELASTLNIDEIVGTNLDYIPSRKHYEMKIFSEDKAEEEYLEIIKESEEKARELGISIYNYPLEMKEVSLCSENPLENIYISHDGAVSPCVYLNVPLRNNIIPRYFKNKQYYIPRLMFGNIRTEQLREICDKKEFLRFRDIYRRRTELWKASEDTLSRILEFSNLDSRIPELPEPCRTCYKAYGV